MSKTCTKFHDPACCLAINAECGAESVRRTGTFHATAIFVRDPPYGVDQLISNARSGGSCSTSGFLLVDFSLCSPRACLGKIIDHHFLNIGTRIKRISYQQVGATGGSSRGNAAAIITLYHLPLVDESDTIEGPAAQL